MEIHSQFYQMETLLFLPANLIFILIDGLLKILGEDKHSQEKGDSVYVPKGMTLLVDTSTPKLFSVIVDGGSIFFSDEKDMTFDASYFLLNGG